MPVTFRATITLRDPLGDDKEYVASYHLSLRDLMAYTMPNTLPKDTTPGSGVEQVHEREHAHRPASRPVETRSPSTGEPNHVNSMDCMGAIRTG